MRDYLRFYLAQRKTPIFEIKRKIKSIHCKSATEPGHNDPRICAMLNFFNLVQNWNLEAKGDSNEPKSLDPFVLDFNEFAVMRKNLDYLI